MKNNDNSSISHKEFKEGALIRASPHVFHICKHFELHFQDRIKDAYAKSTRITSQQFLKEYTNISFTILFKQSLKFVATKYSNIVL